MIKRMSWSVVALLLACLPVAPAQAQALSSRTFVSAAIGNDANDCSRATPCRSFQGAHDKTNAGGEITVLDAGGYGAVTITKSISIVNDGVGEASLLVSGAATGITVDGAGAVVNLRGITVQGIGFGGGFGLIFNRGAALTITNCVFRNLTNQAIGFFPNQSGSSSLSVSDTLVADTTDDLIRIDPQGTNVAVVATIDRVKMVNGGHWGMYVNGFNSTGTLTVAVTNSTFANNVGTGLNVSSDTGKATVTTTLIRSVVANNGGFGLFVGTATLRVGQSVITGNLLAFGAGAGVLQSFGDNYFAGNGNGDPNPPTTIARN